MINADKFKSIFGLYATELWSMPEKDFLKWLNSEAMNCSEIPNNSDTISRQAAINGFYEMASNVDYLCTVSDYVHFLECLPSAEPYTDEEIQKMSELEQAEIEKAYELGKESMRKIGHWILLETMKYDLAYGSRIYIPQAKCSCCRHIYESYVRWDEPIMPEDADFPRYCECCGAKMEDE